MSSKDVTQNCPKWKILQGEMSFMETFFGSVCTNIAALGRALLVLCQIKPRINHHLIRNLPV